MTTLPLCVRIDFADARGRSALITDGWREIETLSVFERDGLPAQMPVLEPGLECEVVEPSAEFSSFVAECGSKNSHGRLARDSRVSLRLARESYQKWLINSAELPNTTRILAKLNGVKAGFMLIGEDRGVARINFFAVEHKYRRLGVGKALLWKACALCKPTLRAGTQANNTPAVNLYLKQGFKLVEQQRTFHK